MPVHSRMCAALVVALTALTMRAALAEPIEFIVLGDMPYNVGDTRALEEIGKAIRSKSYPFAIHYGDIKHGESPCNEQDLLIHFEFIERIFKDPTKDTPKDPPRHPVFYTPGDNDWTDCDRKKTHQPISEIDALRRLRKLFFSHPKIQRLQQRYPELEITQADPKYPENLQWHYKKIQFVTLHVVGSDNGRTEILESNMQKSLEAVDARDKANRAVLDQVFSSKRAKELNAIVIVIHADPTEIEHKHHRRIECTKDEKIFCNPYLGFLNDLNDKAKTFKKPVLLVHGSTDDFCLDKPSDDKAGPTFWRLNGPGDFKVRDAAVVTFDPAKDAPISVKGVLNTEREIKNCHKKLELSSQ